MKKSLRRRIIAAFILLFLIFLISWLNAHPQWIEEFYAIPVYPALGYLLRLAFGWIPFSAGDVLYLAATVFLVWQLVKFFKRLFGRRFRHSLLHFLNLTLVLEGGIVIFYLFWGMNYFRFSTAERLELQREKYTIEELRPAAEYVIRKANHYRSFISQEDMEQVRNSEIYLEAEQAYGKLGKINPAFRIRDPRVKPALFTPLINYMGVAGYFNPFTGEAQVNYAMPAHLKPFVACHEIAHQAGFGPEDAASFAGFLAGTHSGNVMVQYSVYYTAMEELMNEIARMDWEVYRKLYTSISPQVRDDLDVEYYYWSYFRGPVDVLSDIFYDNFLKANNQPKGLRTYNEMISLLVAYYKTQGIL